MAKTTGLLFVVPARERENAVRFYWDAFDIEEVFCTEQIVFVGQRGTDTAVGILLDPDGAGQRATGEWVGSMGVGASACLT